VLNPRQEKGAIGKTGERIVQREVIGVNGRLEKVGANLGIDKVRRSHISQRLRDDHVLVTQGAKGVAIQVERPEPQIFVAEGKAEYGTEAGLSRLGAERGELVVLSEIRDGDRLARSVRSHAWTFLECRLQFHICQRPFVGGGHMVRAESLGNECDAGARYGHGFDNAVH
jgi:hypothetical protein